MSIMFPTIFALGIFGLGQRAKKASSFIVMAIVGGALLPKLMGEVADRTSLNDMVSDAYVRKLHLKMFDQTFGIHCAPILRHGAGSGSNT